VARITREKFLSSSCVPRNLETLHERQAGVDHHGELAREDGELFADTPLPRWPSSCRRLVLDGIDAA
jgi:hypothetical protein